MDIPIHIVGALNKSGNYGACFGSHFERSRSERGAFEAIVVPWRAARSGCSVFGLSLLCGQCSALGRFMDGGAVCAGVCGATQRTVSDAERDHPRNRAFVDRRYRPAHSVLEYVRNATASVARGACGEPHAGRRDRSIDRSGGHVFRRNGSNDSAGEIDCFGPGEPGDECIERSCGELLRSRKGDRRGDPLHGPANVVCGTGREDDRSRFRQGRACDHLASGADGGGCGDAYIARRDCGDRVFDDRWSAFDDECEPPLDGFWPRPANAVRRC
jgi:hypothetical protein